MRAHSIEKSLELSNILVIGDVIIDHYLVGKVDRISPEAPVPVVLHQEERYCLGGAANVALNIKAMGATPHLLTVVGQDKGYQQLIQLLEESDIHQHYLVVDPSRRTTQKTRIMARQQQLLRYDQEDDHALSPLLEQQVVERVKTLLQGEAIDALVLQDYNKGLLSAALIERVVQLAKQQGIPVLADPKKANFLAYKGVDWFKPNLREINEGLGVHLSEATLREEDLAAVAQRLKAHLGNSHTVITLGAKGLYATAPEGAVWVSTRVRAIADVCGAGDTVISVLAAGVAAQLPWKTILRMANMAGGQVCERVGVVALDRNKLLEEYRAEERLNNSTENQT